MTSLVDIFNRTNNNTVTITLSQVCCCDLLIKNLPFSALLNGYYQQLMNHFVGSISTIAYSIKRLHGNLSTILLSTWLIRRPNWISRIIAQLDNVRHFPYCMTLLHLYSTRTHLFWSGFILFFLQLISCMWTWTLHTHQFQEQFCTDQFNLICFAVHFNQFSIHSHRLPLTPPFPQLPSTPHSPQILEVTFFYPLRCPLNTSQHAWIWLPVNDGKPDHFSWLSVAYTAPSFFQWVPQQVCPSSPAQSPSSQYQDRRNHRSSRCRCGHQR